MDSKNILYKGSGPVSADVLGGQVPLGVVDVPSAISNVKAGKLRALAVTDSKRTELMPEVPTMKEAGIDGVEVSLWYGLLAPGATPRAIVEQLAAATARATRDAGILEQLRKQGAEPVGNSAAEFNAYLREEFARWSEVVKVSGARVE